MNQILLQWFKHKNVLKWKTTLELFNRMLKLMTLQLFKKLFSRWSNNLIMDCQNKGHIEAKVVG